MKRTRFTISTPVYKQSEFIDTALASIRAQKEPFELAVLDATPDNSAQKIIQNYRDIITYQYHHKDDGQAAAIQEGWDNTGGDIAAWLNADDYFFPDTLSVISKVFEKHPEVDVVFGHAVLVRENGSFEMYFPSIEKELQDTHSVFIIYQPSCFVRKHALTRVGGLNTLLHYVMDLDLWQRLFKAGSTFMFVDHLLSVGKLHPNTKTNTPSKQKDTELAMVLPRTISNIFKKRWYSLLSYPYNLLTALREHPILAWPLHSTRKIKRFFFKTKNWTIYGLKRYTNEVENSCDIYLPWYEKKPPTMLEIITSVKGTLTVTYADATFTIESSKKKKIISFGGTTVSGYSYVAPLLPHHTNLLHFSLRHTAPSWRLFSLLPYINEKI